MQLQKSNKFGINETLELLAAFEAIIQEIGVALEDDGKISGDELIPIVFRLALRPELMEGIQGINQIPQELFTGDLNEEELILIRDKGYGKFLDNPNLIFFIYHLSGTVNYGGILYNQTKNDGQPKA